MLNLAMIMKDMMLLVIGGVIGFFFSYTQWKLSLNHADREQRREKLEELDQLLSQYGEFVRYVIHRRNMPDLFYPDVGPNPIPQIITLKNAYAPEIASQVDEVRKLYSSTVEKILSPSVTAFDPIQVKLAEAQKLVRIKINTLS